MTDAEIDKESQDMATAAAFIAHLVAEHIDAADARAMTACMGYLMVGVEAGKPLKDLVALIEHTWPRMRAAAAMTAGYAVDLPVVGEG